MQRVLAKHISKTCMLQEKKAPAACSHAKHSAYSVFTVHVHGSPCPNSQLPNYLLLHRRSSGRHWMRHRCCMRHEMQPSPAQPSPAAAACAQEWEVPQPSRRPDIFPEFEKMDKVFLPKPLPGDPEMPDEEDEESKKRTVRQKRMQPAGSPATLCFLPADAWRPRPRAQAGRAPRDARGDPCRARQGGRSARHGHPHQPRIA